MRTIPQSEIDYIENNRHSSLNKIAKELNRSRSTISKYLKRTPEEHAVIVKASQSISANLVSKNIQDKGIAYANKLFESHKQEELFLVGIALYWAEGKKTRGTISMSNSDQRIIRIFYKWAKRYVPETRLAIRLQAPRDGNISECRKHWEDLFPDVRISTIYIGKNTKVKYGVCNLEILGIRGARTFIHQLMDRFSERMDNIAS